MAFFHALKWAHDTNSSNVVFESNCKYLVDTICSNQNGSMEFHRIVARCRALLSIIPNSIVSFVRRQSSQVAHNLAKASRFHDRLQLFYQISTCIFPKIINEMQ
ncbi:hypothetical protein JHK85_021669 [Glycine max]|uniref:RNase H type-1 domain-containing protein n=2 Tax=Glycine subgen. Soja TaxID=1462606 RepID=A0A0R0IRZ4_SOYBN|nr:hypothetical protein JHK85_021669 [Glycine max]KAG5025312.1 hypothetical protein JHK86_021226 [Glycine max]RZB96636.1 hypothetical protein D0Y65_020396 [Glycine soja]